MKDVIFSIIWVLSLGLFYICKRMPSSQEIEERNYKCRYNGGTIVGYKCFIGDKEITR